MNNSTITQGDFGKQLEEMVRNFVQEKLEMVLKEEINQFLSEEETDDPNSRNGYYKRIFDTQFGRIKDLSVPRDRKGDFQTALFPPYQRRNGWLEEAILTLYKSGVSTRQVGKFVERMLDGNSYSATTVSNITEKVREDIEAFHKAPLEKTYFALYLDALYVKVRRDTVEKEAVYVVLGITLEGKREIVDFYIGGRESSSGWKELLSDLYQRGLQKVSIGIFDGLSGLEEAFRDVYPKADVQRCVVHKVRSTLSKVRKKDQAEVAQDLRTIYRADHLKAAQEAFASVQEKWGTKYKRELKAWEDELSVLLTFYNYPKEIRSYLYTTNMIERLNKEIRKRIKTMNSLPSIEACEKIVFLSSKEYNDNWTTKRTPGYALASKEIYKIHHRKYGKKSADTPS